MRKLHPLLFTWFLLATFSVGFSQSTVKISNTDAELRGNSLSISYDLSDYQAGESFNVWVEITDKNGSPLSVRSVTGDIGDHVSGGEGKEILWNHVADGVTLNVGINIQVFARPMESPVKEDRSEKTISATGLVLQSLGIPGLGLSRATGKPHWLRGVAGYACIGSAIALNRMSVNSYNEYLEESDITTRNELFEDSEMQAGISQVLAFTAGGIWITDIIWNLVGASNLSHIADGKGFSIQPGYQPAVQAPLLSLSYRF